VRLGLTKIRLTGGEPLVKRGIVELAGMIRAVPGVGHLAMTTNGTLLARSAAGLRRAGLDS
jgi:cyclic pyranopterin phosphate synthase